MFVVWDSRLETRDSWLFYDMTDFNIKRRIIITCNKRLAPFLEKEVVELGFTPVRVFGTGVELDGSLNDCVRLNLNLRCGSQVLYSLRSFRADNPEGLYKVLVGYAWERVLAEDGYFSVTSTVNTPTINNEMFLNVKVKDAIADRFMRERSRRPDSGPQLDRAVIHIYWKDDQAEVFIDTSGETLSKHAYRKIPGKAPMLEALATATLLASKWDRKSPLINPMCGSGTVAIEAALLATNRRPGLLRKNYAFMHVVGFDKSFYDAEVQRLQDQVREVEGLHIVATDLSEDAVQIAKVNAGLAGVESLIHFDQCDFAQTAVPPEAGGVVFFNPEYGERLGEVSELEETYARLGDFLKKSCKGYTGYVFTGNMDLAKKIGLKASRRIEFYSAKLDCRLLEYELYSGSRDVRKNANIEQGTPPRQSRDETNIEHRSESGNEV
jgi:23S rRNA G2445 N2-methylase RlmL